MADAKNRKRKRGIYESEVQNGRIKKTITEHLTSPSFGFSQVTVWHPNTAQKSYKKEKRQVPNVKQTDPPECSILRHPYGFLDHYFPFSHPSASRRSSIPPT